MMIGCYLKCICMYCDAETCVDERNMDKDVDTDVDMDTDTGTDL